MAGDGATVEKLRQYLRELKPEARSLLIVELERGLLRGEAAAGADLILQELRRIIREQREGMPRIGNSARMFFRPLEPFLVDDDLDHRHPGRVSRAALDSLWTWIRRDLLPDDAKTLTEAVGDALLADDASKAEQLVRTFQDRAVVAIADNLATAQTYEKARRRIAVQIATPRASEDAAALLRVLRGRDLLDVLSAQLPVHVANLSHERLAETKAQIDAVAAHDGDLFVYALLMVMSRLAAPWQLVRLATQAAASDTAARVADTPYAVAVTIVLAEMERLVSELEHDLHSGGVAVGALLKVIHDCVRGLRTEMELPVDNAWGRQLAALRARMSDLLKSEIESMPGRVRRLLRPRPSTEIRANSLLDSADVAETEALIEFVDNCRHFANELAINEMTQRAFSELQQFLDGGVRALLDGLRHAGDADRSFRQSQVDAAVRFSGKAFGGDYAAMLGRAAAVAGSPERKAVRA